MGELLSRKIKETPIPCPFPLKVEGGKDPKKGNQANVTRLISFFLGFTETK
jgi:hypothetical protein